MKRIASNSVQLASFICRQLPFVGRYLDGIYLIANPDTHKIETVILERIARFFKTF